MIPKDIRLYTWVDVEEILFRIQPNDWPPWLIWVRVYIDGLRLGVQNAKEYDVISWLISKFEPRFDKNNLEIILESADNSRKILEVTIEETNEKPRKNKFIPSFNKATIFYSPESYEHPVPFKPDVPPVIAFHSFKGGVGRTHLALAFAISLTEQYKEKPVLLVDGDLEAPGLNWMLQKRSPNFPISYTDFLSLVHSDPDPDAKESLDLVSNRLQNAKFDNIYILPAFRTIDQFTSREIRPEHLVRGGKNPFIISELLAELGKKLGVSAVIIDLRAGFSEMSAGVLFDPRVNRILVTTLSSQSLQGTIQTLKLLGRLSPSINEFEPVPGYIINQVPEEFNQTNENYSNLLSDIEQEILEAANGFLDPETTEQDLPHKITYFNPKLQIIPPFWEDVYERLKKYGIVEDMKELNGWFPNLEKRPIRGQEFSEDLITILKSKRKVLSEFTDKLIVAETANIDDFLTTNSIRNLVSDFQSRVPIAVVVGAKGSGKTYTYLRIVQRSNWQTFSIAAKIPNFQKRDIHALILPVIWSKNLKNEAQNIVPTLLRKSIIELGLNVPEKIEMISDYIDKKLSVNFSVGEWREIWLNIIAWRSGYKIFDETAGRQFPYYLQQNKKTIVALIDGLEDNFQYLTTKENQQVALRALIQEVPQWLEQQPSNSIGLLVFVRKDMVFNSIRQNTEQFLAPYNQYQLKWDEEEALRLAAWIAWKASVMDGSEPNYTSLKLLDLVEKLNPLWGRKLGSEQSKEARSAPWVISALSDFKGNIQARDLVRFLHESALISIDDEFWKDRLLVPSAIRKALSKCSEKKITEIESENTQLMEIFSKLKSLDYDKKQIPFTRETIGLSKEEMDTLESNGVVLREKEEYYIPEIFREGLVFSLKTGARPKVLKLSRRPLKLK